MSFFFQLKLEQNYLIKQFFFIIIIFFLLKEGLCFSKTLEFNASDGYSGKRQYFPYLQSFHFTSSHFKYLCSILHYSPI